jgi:hypothetical protein
LAFFFHLGRLLFSAAIETRRHLPYYVAARKSDSAAHSLNGTDRPPFGASIGPAPPNLKIKNLNLDVRFNLLFDENAFRVGGKNAQTCFSTFFPPVQRLRGAAQQHVGCASRWVNQSNDESCYEAPGRAEWLLITTRARTESTLGSFYYYFGF